MLGFTAALQFSDAPASATPQTPHGKPLAESVADCYMRSFPSESRGAHSKADKDRSAYDIRPAELEEKVKREVVFNSVFRKSTGYVAAEQAAPPVLNPYAWADLKLFYGTTTTPEWHLMKRVNRTLTVLGEGALATMLAAPISDIQELTRRQKVIRRFIETPEEANRLREALRAYSDAEESHLSLWTSRDPLYTKEYVQYMEDKFYAKGNDPSNKSVGWLEFKKRFFRDFWSIQLPIVAPVILPAALELFFDKELAMPMIDKESIQRAKAMNVSAPKRLVGLTLRRYYWTGIIPYYGGWFKYATERDKIKFEGDIGSFPVEKVDGLKMIAATVIALQEIAYTLTAYGSVSNYLEYSKVLRNLAERMADVQAFVKAAKAIDAQVAASPALEELYGQDLQGVRALLQRTNEGSELGQLMRYLNTLPYHNWSYFFNNAGKLLASHTLFTEHKDAFVDAMHDVGKLDAFLSVATLVDTARTYDDDHQYVFTQFLNRKQQPHPYMRLVGMWNPFLDAKHAVTNDVTMDASKGIRNLILTGPNAGGKSTFLTGITTSLLLSQTFGIAPVKEMTMTPFDKISTYIDATDDIAAGKSLFMAEVDRAQQHLEMLKKLKSKEFSFTIFDEPFSGTNPIEGAAAEYSILEAMGEYDNALSIVATHYPIVMLLEERAKNRGFANYKVYIKYKPGMKKINYTYKVIPGRSNQAIAIDILEEEGYNTHMLRRAREIIAHPERYQAKFGH